ncbi:lysophospholipid acyltransferase family protein [Poseidonibacter ostreae]|uniref:1-acyl-sn-glycerol-3-phosphate acyltransferase n=1 Tax=Poseidonibacter ostreae TaxID=2654171 RepID=A0A6L4WTM5_9BACT|nr:lysophospholipid acyltransferase family protein [Poseidonibacter ostreae]KAB7886006.1 1-acylglycerol-3-phosphate O-acyltransferase [Poseidonibacter ostreae]KAB7889458.1 1-acylglycerol-3-phosphate O-acyltransferase [Poseidonibacter ostreae]KAB7892529.1 1-acylglycerol-3-phosphate O-acyltransferase [Poseidonibacter ostreae]MAC84222.1 1-acyl-sn-glycerol-3-phosphate acyltransferase [Arcobacter sp.]
MAKIRGIILLIQFSITVAITVCAMYLFRNHTHKVIKIWMNLQIKFLGIKIQTQGTLDESCDLVLMNHQSLLDIIIVEYLHNRDLAWVAKKEISDLFFFGHIIKAPRMISIDRENKAGIIHLFKEVKDRLDKGRPIAMFPEGTRSDGTKMLKFKAGAKMVANKYKLKVQPVLIFNTRNIVDSKKLEATPGLVKVIYLDPVQADKTTSWFEDTEENMKTLFEEEIKKYDS